MKNSRGENLIISSKYESNRPVLTILDSSNKMRLYLVTTDNIVVPVDLDKLTYILNDPSVHFGWDYRLVNPIAFKKIAKHFDADVDKMAYETVIGRYVCNREIDNLLWAFLQPTKFKPTLCVDIDGIIYDFDSVARDHIEKYFGVCLEREDNTTYYYEKKLGISDEEMKKWWDDFNANNRWQDIALVPGAKKSLELLSDFFKIVLVTSRSTSTGGDNIKEITYNCLDRDGIWRDQLIFTDSTSFDCKVSTLKEKNIRPMLFIEDHPKFSMELADAGYGVVLFRYPWNKDVKRGYKLRLSVVDNWKEAVDEIFLKLHTLGEK